MANQNASLKSCLLTQDLVDLSLKSVDIMAVREHSATKKPSLLPWHWKSD